MGVGESSSRRMSFPAVPGNQQAGPRADRDPAQRHLARNGNEFSIPLFNYRPLHQRPCCDAPDGLQLPATEANHPTQRDKSASASDQTPPAEPEVTLRSEERRVVKELIC